MMSFHTNKAFHGNEDERNFIVNPSSEFHTDMMFKSHQDLIDWVQNMGRSLGYVIIIKRTKTRPNGFVSKVDLICDRGGIYKRNKISSRNTATKKINCPFQLVGKHLKLHGFWTLKVVCEKHNHEASLNMEGHPYAMRLSDEETRLVFDLMKKNVKPTDILSTLKERNASNVSSLKTIYNARQKYLKYLKDNCVEKPTEECPRLNDNFLKEERVDMPIEEPFGCSYLDTSKFIRFDVTVNHESSRNSSYIDQLPKMFRGYITQIQDVRSDGNCGFRAIAVCLGLHEDAWSTIRSDLMEELNTHKKEYDQIFGRECRLQLHNSLNFFRPDIAASVDHWMIMPDMGILIASKYNVILICLSVGGDSMTYLPLRSTPSTFYQHVAIAIGHVNDNHYVKLTLEGDYPMPPVVPQWFHFRHEYASVWVTPYINQLNMYIQNYHSNSNVGNINSYI